MADNTTLESSGGFENTTDAVKSKLDLSTIRYGYFIGMGIIISLGFLCNTLSIAVFAKSKSLRQSTTGLYLVSLAVADLLFLLGELLRWLDTEAYIPGYNFMSYSNAACQFVYSLRYTAKLTSAWITVVITAQRYFIVAFPLKAGSICTRKQAYIGIASTYLVCFLVGCYPVLCVGVGTWNGKPLCMYVNKELYDILSWVFLRVGSLLLPGTIVLVLTVLICVILARARITRNRHLSENRTNKNKMSRQSSNSSVDRQLTLMLLAVAIAFVLLRLPYTILYYINLYQDDIWDPIDDSTRYTVYALYKVSDLFASLNYALNFFLYCLSGTAFRLQCISMFGCDEATQRKSASYGPTSSGAHTPNGQSSVEKTAYTRQTVVCASDDIGKDEENMHMGGYGDLRNTTLETMD